MIAFPGGEARAGDAWVGHGPPGGAVSAMAAAPDGAVVVAGLGTHGLWRSADGGATWAEVGGFAAAGKRVDTVALSPAGAIHVGVSQVGFQGGELLVSDDGGATFTSLLTAIDQVTRVTFDPTVPGRFYVSTANTGLYRTDDGGATFATVDGLFPLDPFLRAVAVDPGDPDHLYIGTQVGVVVTEDGGATLSIVGGGPTDAADIVIDPGDSKVVVAGGFDGLFRSTDGGASWQEYGGGPSAPRVQALSSDPAHGRLWAATLGGGVLGSLDFGQSWEPGGAGVEPDVLSLALGPDGGLLAGGGYGGVYTRDAAGVFKQTSAGMTASTAERVVVSGGRWLAVTRGAGLFASTDGGATWEIGAAAEPALGAVTDAADCASAPEVVYAGTRSGDVLRSSDGGVGWAVAGSAGAAPIARLAVSPVDPDKVYAAQEEGAGWVVRESVDGGASWHPYGSVIEEAPVSDMLFGGEPPRLFVATDGDGLFVSNDGGATFEPPGVIPTDDGRFVLSLAYDPLMSTLYAGLHGNGVARSDDGGATWVVAASTGLTDWWVYALAPHPTAAGTLYAGTYDGGVARSDDRGETFTLLSDGLGPGVVSSLRFATGTTLVACTRGSGVFSIEQPAEGGSGGAGGTGGAGGSGGGTGGAGGDTGGAGGGGAAPAGGGGAGGTGGGAAEDPSEGCSCRAAGTPGDGWPAGSAWTVVGLGWLLARRRRRSCERRTGLNL